DKANRPFGQKTERDRGPARQMPRKESLSPSCCVVQTSPAPPKKINRPGTELGEDNVGRQRARHDEIEQRTLQNQRAPESDATAAQRAPEEVTDAHSVHALHYQRQTHRPLRLPNPCLRND